MYVYIYVYVHIYIYIYMYMSIVKNEPLFCFQMILPYILNFIGNKKMQLTLIFWFLIKLND